VYAGDTLVETVTQKRAGSPRTCSLITDWCLVPPGGFDLKDLLVCSELELVR
jgi:hypothetical protein